MALGHGRPVELALAVVAAAGHGQDAAVAAVQHHDGPLANGRPGAGQELAQAPFHHLLQERIEVGFHEEVALGRHGISQ